MGGLAQSGRLAALLRRLMWQARRGLRVLWRTGPIGGVVVVSLVVTLGTVALQVRQRAELQRLAQQHDSGPGGRVPAVPEAPTENDTQRQLSAFEAQLSSYEEAGVVLQDLIDQAQARGLALPRGEYQLEQDTDGRFLRYRMNFPVKGRADVVPSFIAAVLVSHKALALEAVHFRRERANSPDVEARMQFVLLMRPSAAHGGKPAGPPARVVSGASS